MSIKISRQCVSTSTWKTLNRRADILRLQLRKGALSQNERAKNNRFVFFFVLTGKQRFSSKEFNCCIKQYSSRSVRIQFAQNQKLNLFFVYSTQLSGLSSE